MIVFVMQVDTSSAQLAHDQPAIDYCFKPALGYKATGQSAGQAVLKILTTLREVADNAQVRLWQHFTARTKHEVGVPAYPSTLVHAFA